MESLRQYLNSLSRPDQEAYALRCHTTVGYLRKALSTKPRFDGAFARILDEESGGKVRRAELRPDIWPELVQATEVSNA